MSNEFKQEERYVVFKLADLGNSLKGDEIRQLAREYAEQRRTKGKEPLRGLFIESDWPEYEPTWKAIEARVTGAQPAPSFADAYQGAMEEVAIWKRRTLEAEKMNLKLIAEINGPTHMGEPAQPAPSGVQKVVRGFRWDSEAQHHIPTLEVEFTPVPSGFANDSKGWQERDRLAKMLGFNERGE